MKGIAGIRSDNSFCVLAIGDISEEMAEAQELVEKLEENTRKMYRTANARYILLKVAEDYLAKGKTAQVIDRVYGAGITNTIGRAIKKYYGLE